MLRSAVSRLSIRNGREVRRITASPSGITVGSAVDGFGNVGYEKNRNALEIAYREKSGYRTRISSRNIQAFPPFPGWFGGQVPRFLAVTFT